MFKRKHAPKIWFSGNVFCGNQKYKQKKGRFKKIKNEYFLRMIFRSPALLYLLSWPPVMVSSQISQLAPPNIVLSYPGNSLGISNKVYINENSTEWEKNKLILVNVNFTKLQCIKLFKLFHFSFSYPLNDRETSNGLTSKKRWNLESE